MAMCYLFITKRKKWPKSLSSHMAEMEGCFYRSSSAPWQPLLFDPSLQSPHVPHFCMQEGGGSKSSHASPTCLALVPHTLIWWEDQGKKGIYSRLSINISHVVSFDKRLILHFSLDHPEKSINFNLPKKDIKGDIKFDPQANKKGAEIEYFPLFVMQCTK